MDQHGAGWEQQVGMGEHPSGSRVGLVLSCPISNFLLTGAATSCHEMALPEPQLPESNQFYHSWIIPYGALAQENKLSGIPHLLLIHILAIRFF